MMDNRHEETILLHLQTGDYTDQILNALTSDDMGDPRARRILRAARSLHGKGRPVSLVNLGEELEDEDTFYLTQVAEDIPRGGQHLRDAIEQVKNASLRRQVEDLVNTPLDAENPGEALEGLIRDAEAIRDRTVYRDLTRRTPTEEEAAKSLLEDMKDSRDRLTFASVDDNLGGLEKALDDGLTRGALYVLSAPPSAGKTTLIKQLADETARASRVPVLFFSYEQGALELRLKSLSRLLNTETTAILSGDVQKANPKALEHELETYRREIGPYLRVVEAGRKDDPRSIERITEASMKEAEADTALLIIDYLQLIPARNPLTGRDFQGVRERVDHVLSELRRICRRLNVSVFALSSMARSYYRQEPKIDAFKESGGVEFTADVLLGLWHPDPESEGSPVPPEVKKAKGVSIGVKVLKNRNGRRYRIFGNFVPEESRFTFGGQKLDEITYRESLDAGSDNHR